jgi:hypothetical protein
LQATGLVNEAYIRLIDWNNVQWQNRSHFYGVTAQVMRPDSGGLCALSSLRQEGGGARQVPLDEIDAGQ